MERLSDRDSVLLGYSPQRNITNNYPISSPDIDFHDVFGGPPRRASVQETRCSSSFGETDTESYALTSASHRHRWSGLTEKPVFGEDSIANRRRYPSHDFFDDIFKGNESLSSSPRKNDRDSFASNPGSRVLSPVRPLPPRAAEPFASSSLPAQFSLPAKLIKGTDLPTFGSSARSHHKNKDYGTSNGISFYAHSPLSRFSSQANQAQEDSITDVYSREPSISNLESSSISEPDEFDRGSNLKKDSNICEATSNSNRFHFSIYKWASKGVPLALPVRGGNTSKLKERVKFERSSSASGRIACEGMAKELPTLTSEDTNCPSCSNSVSSDIKSSEIELDKKEKGSFLMTSTIYDRVEQVQTVKEAVILKFETENQRTCQEIVKESPGNNIFQDSKKETNTHSITGTVNSGKGGEKLPVVTQETPKTELKTLRSLISGTDEITNKNESKESKVKNTRKSAAIFIVSEKVKKQVGERSSLNGNEMDTANLLGSPKKSQDSLTKNRARGKVKEFVKIFNQEASSKPTFNIDSQSRSSRWKERDKYKPEDDPTTEVDDKVRLPNGNKNHKSNGSIKKCYNFQVDEFLKQFDKQHSQVRTKDHKPIDISSGLKDRSASTAASIPDGSEAIVGDSDDSFQGNILIKELPQDEDELPQADDNQEVFQVIDAKIRKWSNGKEGNIRSLLSTLQYVLWPESGWKPVPLVDIIEGNAVKRSYQKALLSLHPDKLQQKGATLNQKYTAEKVFDILQEAWTHFCSLGSM